MRALRICAGLGVFLTHIAHAQGPTLRPAPRSSPLERRPNVILILSDDLGYGDLGSYGASDAKTPNLDRLARQGVRFTDAYANAAVCLPTRAALITGRYQQRIGAEWNWSARAVQINTPAFYRRVGSVWRDRSDAIGFHGLEVTPASLPLLLKQSGYATGLIGKWHLGERRDQGPNAHGFDEFFGFLGGMEDYYTHRDLLGRHDLYEDTTEVEVPQYLTDAFTRRAVSFVDRHAGDPFFLEVAYNATHSPFQPPDQPPSAQGVTPPPSGVFPLRSLRENPLDKLPGDSAGPTRQDYVRMLERMDQGVGEILRALETHGLAGNTLVIFTSDNGGEWLSRNAPLFHYKGTLWEGGIRVPLIMRWPQHLPAGKISRQAAVTMDLTASVLAATGTSAGADYPLDGIDLLPMASGARPVVDRDLFWRIDIPTRVQRAARSGSWKLLIDGEDGVDVYHIMLFNLATDPGERHDLASQYPARVRDLRARYAAWEQEVAPLPVGVSLQLLELARTDGVDAVIARYRALKGEAKSNWLFDESQLNDVGYWLLRRRRPADAIRIFLLNVEEYPDAANPYDSLGEAYLAAADTTRAIASYRRSLQLDPRNENASAVLGRLGAQPR